MFSAYLRSLYSFGLKPDNLTSAPLCNRLSFCFSLQYVIVLRQKIKHYFICTYFVWKPFPSQNKTQTSLIVTVNSPHSGPSRWCSVSPAGIPRISPGPCSVAGGVTHHQLPEDTADEPRNGTPRPEPTWGRSGSQAVPARLRSCWWGRWTGPAWGRGCESSRLNLATSRRQTHVANTKTRRSPVGV